jgi:hypothetical protein
MVARRKRLRPYLSAGIHDDIEQTYSRRLSAGVVLIVYRECMGYRLYVLKSH